MQVLTLMKKIIKALKSCNRNIPHFSKQHKVYNIGGMYFLRSGDKYAPVVKFDDLGV